MMPKSSSAFAPARTDAAGMGSAAPPLRFAVTRRAQIVPVLTGRVTSGGSTAPRWLRLRLPVLGTLD
jgi:hypothetical protein